MADQTTQELFSTIPPESKVAIVIPLYGFWKDSLSQQFTAEVLQVALARVKSSKHKVYYTFVFEEERVDADLANIIVGKTQGGNTLNVIATEGSSYGQYISQGLEAAIKETDAKFFIIYSPWILIKEKTIDELLERVNKGDVGFVSGYDVNGIIEPEVFDEYKQELPKEERGIDLCLAGMTRSFVETISIDHNYKTHFFLARDMWQEMFSRGHESVVSQFLPIHSFNVDWTLLEDIVDFNQDRAYFTSKWKFDPGIEFKSN